MGNLKQKFEGKGLKLREEVQKIRKEHGDLVLGEHTVGQAYGGMKSIKGLVYEPSSLDPEEGIRFRGYTIPQIREKLPKAEGGVEPLPEGIFYLMLMDELPTNEDAKEVSDEWKKRSNVPKHVFNTLDALPKTTHPMTMFSTAILSMQTESVFSKAYREGTDKAELWRYMYEDVMNLIGRLPRIAAYIYRRKYYDDDHIEPDPKLDWAANFAQMMGFGDNEEFMRLMRLYLTIHADHEGGNVSAHTVRLVGSSLSDSYYAFSAGMDGLAGPLHGLANQEVIRWINQMRKHIGKNKPTKEDVENYVRETLNQGQVVPGYGHAVLRKTDPRFTAQREFALRYMPDDELIQTVGLLYEVVPGILSEVAKIKNPWPNVDAHSGSLLVHYGMTEYDFYTVLFGVARSLGTLSSLIWDRMLMLPIERPKSVTTKAIKETIKENSNDPQVS